MSVAAPFIADSLQNLVSGLGTLKDKASHGTFTNWRLGKQELDALYETNWMAHTIVDAPADDMTRAWREWQADQASITAIEKAEGKLKVRSKVNRAMKLARLYGGAIIVIGTGDPDPSLPLEAGSLGKGGLRYLTVLHRWEVSVGPLDRDPLSPWHGEPEWYGVSSPTVGMVQVHPSRVIRFDGIPALDRWTAPDSWGVSILQPVYDTIKRSEATAQALASLMQEAKLDIISVPDLTKNILDPQWRAATVQRFALANASKSLNNALLLDKDEEWKFRQVQFAGIPDVLVKFSELVAGAANIPATRLLGKAPGGLNATGDSDIRHYYDTLSSAQETVLRPALEALDECLVRHALGKTPRNASYRFSPLWQLSEVERAGVDKTRAETTELYVGSGLFGKKGMAQAVRNRLLEDGTYPGLADIKEADLKPDPVPVATAAMGAVEHKVGAAA